MKITKEKFANALETAWENLKEKDRDTATYRANLTLVAGWWNYYPIHCVVIDNVKFYCSTCCKTANTDISVIRRICAKN